jgi:excisionase family DNA binding protein
VTVKVAAGRVGPGELRVTLNADIRISGDLGALAGLPGPAATGGHGDARGQDFLTVEQAAEFLHVSLDKVYYLIRTRQLRSIKTGKLRRISRAWIADFAGQQGPDGHGGWQPAGGCAARLPVSWQAAGPGMVHLPPRSRLWVPEVCIPYDLPQRPGQPDGIMVIRVPALALSRLRTGLRLDGPAQPVIGLQGRRAAGAAA